MERDGKRNDCYVGQQEDGVECESVTLCGGGNTPDSSKALFLLRRHRLLAFNVIDGLCDVAEDVLCSPGTALRAVCRGTS